MFRTACRQGVAERPHNMLLACCVACPWCDCAGSAAHAAAWHKLLLQLRTWGGHGLDLGLSTVTQAVSDVQHRLEVQSWEANFVRCTKQTLCSCESRACLARARARARICHDRHEQTKTFSKALAQTMLRRIHCYMFYSRF